MDKGRELDNILTECLERLLDKGEAIEECLASYPQQADELEPLLQMALATRMATAIQPRPEFKDRARYQFRSALQEVELKKRRSFFKWQLRWVTTMTVILVLLLAGSGIVVAATNSMPDGPLYQVKLLTEQVHFALTPSALGKAELAAKSADKRVDEIIYMASEGDTEQVESITHRLDDSLGMITSLVAVPKEESVESMTPVLAPPPESTPASESASEPQPAPAEDGGELTAPRAGGTSNATAYWQIDGKRAELRMMLERAAIDNPDALRAILETTPESTKPALRQAIMIAVAKYQKALEAFR